MGKNPSWYNTKVNSYDTARTLFREKAAQHGARQEKLTHPLGDGLAIDVAIIGHLPCRHMVITTSGVHGIEGYGGSAFQAAMLGACPSPGEAFVHIHAVNPWGMKHGRRGNENGVDLNRNYMSFDPGGPDAAARMMANTDYQKYAAGLIPADWRLWDRLKSYPKFIKTFTDPAARKAITRGQYIDPNGLYYGGQEIQWSLTALHEIFCALEPAAGEKVTYVDLHTGLGKFGEYLVIPEGDAIHRASYYQDYFAGTATVEKVEDTAMVGAALGNPMDVLPSIFGPRIRHTFTVEMGTYHPFWVACGLIGEKAAHGDAAKKCAIEGAFYPTGRNRKKWLQKLAVKRNALWAKMRTLA